MYFFSVVGAALFGLSYARAAASNSSTCFENGIDYVGYDILTLSGVESSFLCMESCAQTSDCMYWSWSSETDTCYLKSSAALLGRTEKSNIISGRRSCDAENSCFLEGVDYVGFDVKKIEGENVPSAQACQELCALEPQCAFFSYKASVKDCYLKSSAAPVGRTADADVTSGPQVCPQTSNDPELPGLPDLPEESCVEGSVEYRGRDVAVMQNVRSASYCQQACVSSVACFFWTWDRTKNTCYLKDERAPEHRYKSRQTVGKVSGAKDCVPVNPGCQLLNTSYVGAVIRQLRNTATFETCQQNCQNDAKCTHWTWVSRTKLCQLRESSSYGYVEDSSTAGVIAGPKYCPNDDVCMEQADYVGYDIEAIEDGSVASAIECRTLCRRTEGCEFWTWAQTTGSCYLKSEDALLGKNNGLSSLGRFSGPRECFIQYGCVEVNAAYLSESATKVKNVSTYSECEQQCKRSSSCNLWTYLTNSRVCLLVTGDSTKTPLDGALSGSAICKQPQAQQAHRSLFAGVKYKATDMAFIDSVKNVQECHYECVNNPKCHVFTFDEGFGCYLYDRPHSDMAQYPTRFPTATSGVVKRKASDNQAFADDIVARGSYVFSDEECANRCSEVPACAIWVYNPAGFPENCTLHGAGVTSTTCTGCLSGTKALQLGTYEGYRYNMPVMDTVYTDNLVECRQKCAEENQAFWTYYDQTRECHLHSMGPYVKVEDSNATCGTAQDPLETE